LEDNLKMRLIEKFST